MLSPILKRFKFIMSRGTDDNLNVDEISKTIFMDKEMILKENNILKETIYDHLRTIKDPEKPMSLEALNVVNEDDIMVTRNFDNSIFKITVVFTPTVPHCSLATLIGLCIRVKLQRCLIQKYKLQIFVKKGSHKAEDEVNKQINDKERVAAAMENSGLQDIVNECTAEED